MILCRAISQVSFSLCVCCIYVCIYSCRCICVWVCVCLQAEGWRWLSSWLSTLCFETWSLTEPRAPWLAKALWLVSCGSACLSACHWLWDYRYIRPSFYVGVGNPCLCGRHFYPLSHLPSSRPGYLTRFSDTVFPFPFIPSQIITSQ